MTTRLAKWLVPITGTVLGVLIAASELGSGASPVAAAVGFAIVVGYWVVLRLLQPRSDLANVLSGMPPDERWDSINLRALSLAAQVMAVILVVVFLAVRFAGGDAMPYAWLGAAFAGAYLGGLGWYRSHS
jgi:hypothetical protein